MKTSKKIDSKKTAAPKSISTRITVDTKLKKQVDSILRRMGITFSEAIHIYLSQIVLNKGLPVQGFIPNKKTQKVMRDAEKGIGVRSFDSAKEMFTYLKMQR